MDTMTKGFILCLAGVITGAVVIGFLQKSPPQGVGGNFFSAESCSIATSTKALIGPGRYREIAATTSRRAWITITSTTTPVYILLNDRKLKTDIPGFMMMAEGANATSTVTFDSQKPYTGAIHGRTKGTASTSVFVTECEF